MDANSFDVELPVDCDDEFWETGDPATNFKQPNGRPSRMAAMIQHIQLAHIISFALRTLYGTKKSRQALGNNINDQKSIAILDSMLNAWFGDIPSHCKHETMCSSAR